MRKIFILFFALCSQLALQAQEKFTVSGTIKDAANGETMIGATVFASKTNNGTASNEYGFYSLNLPARDSIEIRFSFIGYGEVSRTVFLTTDQTLNIELSSGETLEEVVVSAQSFKEEINSTQTSVTKLSMKEAKMLPALFGEVDIIKTLQLKPGVQSGGEGTSGVFVRGGGQDQNLFLLDEATVYNPSHLFGFFSTFNSDAVKDVKLYKGGFPAQYGGRLSSVLDVRLNDGNRKRFAGKGGIGLIASRLTLEAPIVKDKGSFIVSGRRTYADLITRGINQSQDENPEYTPIPDYYFYDLNAKVNYDLSENDRLYLSGYFGQDVFNFSNGIFNFDFLWGNQTASARWNHVFSPKLFLNTTFTYSNYDYTIKNRFNQFDFNLGSAITDFGGKVDFTYAPNTKHSIRFGADVTYHQFEVGRLQAGSDDGDIVFNRGQNLDGTQFGIYLNDDYTVNQKLSLNAGVRLSGFSNDGQEYFNLEPRLAAKYSISEVVSVKASYARMAQYLHLVSNSGASLPTDIWYPSTQNVLPERSDQVVGGISFGLKDEWLISNEFFYKWLDNQIDFRDGADLFANEELEQEFVFGKGWSYGNEFYIERTKGKVTGWIGYTLAWSWRQFDDILDGRQFPFRFDRRHDISVVAMYQINDKWTVTGTFVYSTGNAVSIPEGWFLSQDIEGANFSLVPLYTERNSYRIPAYHRMDLGVVRNFKHSWGTSDLTFSVYNAYDRRNVYFIFMDSNADELTTDPDGNIRPLQPSDIPNLVFTAKQVSLFPIIPSVTWNFSF